MVPSSSLFTITWNCITFTTLCLNVDDLLSAIYMFTMSLFMCSLILSNVVIKVTCTLDFQCLFLSAILKETVELLSLTLVLLFVIVVVVQNPKLVIIIQDCYRLCSYTLRTDIWIGVCFVLKAVKCNFCVPSIKKYYRNNILWILACDHLLFSVGG